MSYKVAIRSVATVRPGSQDGLSSPELIHG